MKQEFKKRQKSGKKANEKQRKKEKTPEIFVERVQKDEKRARIDVQMFNHKFHTLYFSDL